MCEKMKAILNTGSTLKQGMASKGGKKLSQEYMDATAVCFINPRDFEGLGNPEKVLVKTHAGKITVYAREDESLLEKNIFMPRGPWANAVISDETNSTGSPAYKGMDAEVSVSMGRVLKIFDLLGLREK